MSIFSDSLRTKTIKNFFSEQIDNFQRRGDLWGWVKKVKELKKLKDADKSTATTRGKWEEKEVE